MKSNKNETLNPFCFYNRDHTRRAWWLSWIADATLSLHLPCLHLAKLHFVATVTLDQLLCNLHVWKEEKNPLEGIQEGWKRFLNEEHLVFTGDGTGGDFRGSGEGSDDGGEDNVWAQGGVDGHVQASGTVVLHQRGRLPVVGLQTGVQRRLVVVAAADERLACQLSADKSGENT